MDERNNVWEKEQKVGPAILPPLPVCIVRLHKDD